MTFFMIQQPDSHMEPTLRDGEWLAVEQVTGYVGPGLYLVDDRSGNPFVSRVVPDYESGSLQIQFDCEDAHYPSRLLKRDEFNDRVIGMVRGHVQLFRAWSGAEHRHAIGHYIDA